MSPSLQINHSADSKVVASVKPPNTSTIPMKTEHSDSTETAETFDSGFALMQNASTIYELELFASLGEGPLSFGPVCRGKSIQEELRQCKTAEVEKIIQLKLACETAKLDETFTDEQIFRAAKYKRFNANKSFRLLKSMDSRFTDTTCRQLEDQLRTQTLFPLPHLQSSSIDNFFYMRPSRHCPSDTPTSTIIANLTYVMDSLFERSRDYRHKIGFIANMDDWTMKHFSVDYCFQFMQVLQGHTHPAHVDLFLIINPPNWFDRVWKIMKPMLGVGFRRKVHMIPEDRLKDFMEPGFETHLPDELEIGKASVATLVEDFIKFRKYVEEASLDRAGAALDRTAPVWPTQRPGSHGRRSKRRGSLTAKSTASSAASSAKSGSRRVQALLRGRRRGLSREINVSLPTDGDDENVSSCWDEVQSMMSDESNEWYTADLEEFDE